MLNGPATVWFKGFRNKTCCCFSDLSEAGASAYLEPMTDLNALMKQAQAMQQKLQDAQAKMADTTASGTSGGGLVTVAAHADAKRKLDEANGALMREAAGPMAGMNIPGMPKLF